MRARTAIWFECKIRYEKTNEEGFQKKVTEQYAVDALSFSEAEARIMKEMEGYISGEFTVEDVKKAAYKEVFFDDGDPQADRFYKVKLDFITIDEKTEKEKRSRVTYLVQARNLNGAMNAITSAMDTTMNDYDVAAINDTKLMDVFEYQKSDQPECKEQ